ncbi:class I SAM-dependent methyltransferase [Candidatus Giovannonibacteria bacterium]|nr:class I SAM-dependent methyltransferase [Candidatus Giovannonibacteria bacterium]
MKFIENFIIRQFTKSNYWNKKAQTLSWFGVPTRKFPSDFWIYQEILFEKRPDILIECGTKRGGSALFFAHMFDILGKGRVISIDVKTEQEIEHPRITFLKGSSLDVFDDLKPEGEVMVILDSNHFKDHVLKELNLYCNLVTPGQYIVVEDTVTSTVHPRYRNCSPLEAVHEFLQSHPDFVPDRSREKFQISSCPNGYLLKTKN